MVGHIAELALRGPRHPGSPGDLWSRDYLVQVGRDLALETWTVPAAVTICDVGASAELRISGPDIAGPSVIACLPQDRSGATAADGVTGQVVYAGLGREEDYGTIEARGALVLQEIWGLHMTRKVEIAHRRGAAGLIWIHGRPGGRRSAWGLGREPAPLPVVTVSHEDGMWLRRRAGQVVGTLRAEVRNRPGTSDHVLMRRKGTAADMPAVLLVAHRDTTHVSPGANDNGSGVAVVLEVMRATAGSMLPFDLVGALTAAEEGGGIGIAQLAAELADARGGVGAAYAYSLDMLSVGGPLRLVTGSATQATSVRLNGLLRQAASDLGYSLTDYVCPMGLADAGPLIAAGIETAWLFKPDDPRFHTSEDTIEHVNPNDLKAAAEIVMRALGLLAAM
jgi:aminopeptidase YwaD